MSPLAPRCYPVLYSHHTLSPAAATVDRPPIAIDGNCQWFASGPLPLLVGHRHPLPAIDVVVATTVTMGQLPSLATTRRPPAIVSGQRWRSIACGQQRQGRIRKGKKSSKIKRNRNAVDCTKHVHVLFPFQYYKFYIVSKHIFYSKIISENRNRKRLFLK